MDQEITPNPTQEGEITGIIIYSIFILGIVLNIITLSYEPPMFTDNTMFLLLIAMLLSLVCRQFSSRACGFFVMLASVMAGSALLENFQMFSLLFALGCLSNGLVIYINKGMPVQGFMTSRGIHITMDGKTRLSFLGDLSIIGHHSVGDLLIHAALWVRLLYLI